MADSEHAAGVLQLDIESLTQAQAVHVLEWLAHQSTEMRQIVQQAVPEPTEEMRQEGPNIAVASSEGASNESSEAAGEFRAC